MATAAPATNGKAKQQDSITTQSAHEKADLWFGLPIEVIIGCGEFGVGKSVFGVSIADGERTLVYDLEGSCTPYERQMGFTRIDVASTLLEKFGRPATPIERWEWWQQHSYEAARSGKYDVIMVDPFSEIEAGLGDWVYANPTYFGKTKNQFDRSTGLFWGSVKDHLKSHLDTLRALIPTIYITVHMRSEYKGNAPTGKREPKGKETLFELATLYLELAREADAKGNVPDVPSAIVRKCRLSVPQRDENGKIVRDEYGDPKMVALLPPRLPKATPGAVRRYIKNPPDYSKLKAAERVVEKQTTEEELERMRLQRAEAERDAAQAELSKVEQMRLAAEQQRASQSSTPPAHDQATQHAESVKSKTEAAATKATGSQLREIQQRAKSAFASGAEFKQYLADCDYPSSPNNLTESQADDLLVALAELQAARQIAKAKENLDTSGTSETVDCEVTKEPEFNAATPQQVERLKDAIATSGWPQEHQEKYKADRGIGSFRSLSYEQVENLIRLLPLIKRVGKVGKEIGWSREDQAKWLDSRNAKTFFDLKADDLQDRLDHLLKVQMGFESGELGN